MAQITIDKNGWINPTCPYCECVMEFNYSKWWKSDPNLNMYCRFCHFAVEITPSTIDKSVNKTKNIIKIYNESQYAKCNCNGMPHHPYSCMSNGVEEE